MAPFELDLVQRLLDGAARVQIFQCMGDAFYCPANNPRPDQSIKKSICVRCKSEAAAATGFLDPGRGSIEVIDSKKLEAPDKQRIKDLLGALSAEVIASDLAQLDLDSIERSAWDSTKSSLMTDLKDAEPDFRCHIDRLSSLFGAALTAGFSARAHFATQQVDEVYIYNGRMVSYWPVRVAAQEFGVPFSVYEYPPFGVEHYSLTPNLIPHSRIEYARLAARHWEEKVAEGDSEDWLATASKWLLARQRRELEGQQITLLGDALSRVKINLLPNSWARENFNIVFFPSSQYEFAGLPNYFGELNLCQADVIEDVARAFPASRVTIRMHPNQSFTDRNFLASIERIADLPAIEIVDPPSPVDSYRLAQEADVVVTFGSTMTIEASALGATVIEAGLPFYSELGACRGARTADELLSAVRGLFFEWSENDGLTPRNPEPQAAVRAQAALMAFPREPKYLQADSTGQIVVTIGGTTARLGPSRGARALAGLLEWLESPALKSRRLVDAALLVLLGRRARAALLGLLQRVRARRRHIVGPGFPSG